MRKVLSKGALNLKVYQTASCAEAFISRLMAAFRYPHRTRPNSGLDQIILVLKVSTAPIRS